MSKVIDEKVSPFETKDIPVNIYVNTPLAFSTHVSLDEPPPEEMEPTNAAIPSSFVPSGTVTPLPSIAVLIEAFAFCKRVISVFMLITA